MSSQNQPWNLLVQPNMRKFHRELESLKLYAQKLSSTLSEWQDFLRRLQCSPLWISENLWHASTKESGPDSSIGVLKGIHYCSIEATIQQVAEFFLYLHRGLSLFAITGRWYRSACNHVFTLSGMGLVTDRVVSRMLSSFEKAIH